MLKRFRGRARLAMAGGLVVALVLVVSGALALLVPSQAAGAQSALTVLTGEVEVQAETGGAFAPAVDGSLLNAGSTIRTGKGANAVVTFFDGSTVTIEPESELTLDQVEATSRGDVLIAMTQKLGKTWHVIGHKLTGQSHYLLKTPTATASVRGTAYRAAVGEHVTALETVDGEVTADLGGQVVNIGEGQVCPLGHKLDGSELPPGATAPPSFEPVPLPAPPPKALAKVVIDPTQAESAMVTTKDGLSVGVANLAGGGLVPVRYAPGSKVERVGDKLVLSIPLSEPGRLSTIVKAFDETKAMSIQTQIESKGEVIANTIEFRQPDASGIAKGGVVMTDQGVLVLPDKEAQMFTAPNLGKAPANPVAGLPFFAQNVAGPTPIVLAPLPGSTQPVSTEVASQGATGGFVQGQAFLGGFQSFQSLGSAAQAQGGVLAPSTQNFVSFADLPPQLAQQLSQFIPAAPPGARDLANVPGFSFRPDLTQPGGASGQPFRPGVPFSTNVPFAPGQDGAPFPFASGLPAAFQFAGGSPGPNPFGVSTNPFAPQQQGGGQLGSPIQEGCQQTPFGLVCIGVATPTDPSRATPTNIPPCAEGQFPTAAAPCSPTGAGGGASASPGFGGPSGLPPCAAGQQPTAAAPCDPTSGTGATGTCPEGFTGTPPNCTSTTGGTAPTTGSFSPFPTTTFATCTPPLVPLPDGRCGSVSTFSPTTTFPTTTFVTCTPPLVLLPDGRCGSVSTFSPTATFPTTTFVTCTPPLVLLPDGRCGEAPTFSAGPSPTFSAGPSPTFGAGPSPTFSAGPSPTQGTFTCPSGTVQTGPNTCSTPTQEQTQQPAPTDGGGVPPPPPPGDTSTPPPDGGAPPPPPPPPPG